MRCHRNTVNAMPAVIIKFRTADSARKVVSRNLPTMRPSTMRRTAQCYVRQIPIAATIYLAHDRRHVNHNTICNSWTCATHLIESPLISVYPANKKIVPWDKYGKIDILILKIL